MEIWRPCEYDSVISDSFGSDAVESDSDELVSGARVTSSVTICVYTSVIAST